MFYDLILEDCRVHVFWSNSTKLQVTNVKQTDSIIMHSQAILIYAANV